MNFKKLIFYCLSFIIPFVIFIIIIPNTFDLELDQNGILVIMALSLVVFLAIISYKKVGHQGSMPLFIGGVIFLISLIPLVLSLSINGSDQYIELSARSQGFALIGVVIGLIILAVGLKQSTSNAYWWGRGGR